MFQFGDFILDVKKQRLLAVVSQSEVAIEPKLLELLVLFIERPNCTITRQDILNQLWAGSIVTDNAINKLIGNLRKVLGDEAKNPRYIQTVPKRGYRLVCQVKPIDNITRLANDNGVIKECQLATNLEPNKLIAASNRYINVVIIFSFALALYIFWQFIPGESDIKTGYSIALTRAQGVEFSPKMHPDNEHLYYLKEQGKDNKSGLWLKNINTAVTKRVELNSHISEIISVTTQGDSTRLIFLERGDNRCVVYQAFLSLPNLEELAVKTVDKLFDCRDKRIKDIDYHQQQNALYYTAQPKNFWPNHIYAFDIESKKHRLITQIEPTGWGHHTIDISPDGKKLLIMSTSSDHKTQLLALDLLNNEITEGLKFERPVYEAIWHHDSEQVFYYSEPPAHQIIKSNLNGEGAIAIISVSEELSEQMSRVPDSKNLLFTTESKNFDNRWLFHSSNSKTINNSIVSDSSPALFHYSDQYLFASKRSGRMQLYLVDNNDEAKIVTNFSQPYSFGYMSIAPDDKNILLTLDDKVYLLPVAELSRMNPMTLLKREQLIYHSEVPIISIDWQGVQGAAITVVKNGSPELIIVDLLDKKNKELPGKWAYGFTDAKRPGYFYLIEQQSNRLHQAELTATKEHVVIKLDKLNETQIVLSQEFYLVKIDNAILYYVTSENGREYLHSVPLDNKSPSRKFLLNYLARYDVSQGNIMVSDMANQQGDIYRTEY